MYYTNLSIYNLLDRYNASYVNGATGRPYSGIVKDIDRDGFRSLFNTIEDGYKNPGMFTTPREIKIGLEVEL